MTDGFIVELVPVGPDVSEEEAHLRLRAALKVLLRAFRLRCVRVVRRRA